MRYSVLPRAKISISEGVEAFRKLYQIMKSKPQELVWLLMPINKNATTRQGDFNSIKRRVAVAIRRRAASAELADFRTLGKQNYNVQGRPTRNGYPRKARREQELLVQWTSRTTTLRHNHKSSSKVTRQWHRNCETNSCTKGAQLHFHPNKSGQGNQVKCRPRMSWEQRNVFQRDYGCIQARRLKIEGSWFFVSN